MRVYSPCATNEKKDFRWNTVVVTFRAHEAKCVRGLQQFYYIGVQVYCFEFTNQFSC